MKWNEELNWFNSSIAESSFIAYKNVFVNNTKRGLEYVKKTLVPHLGGGECFVSSEIIYQKNPNLEKYKDSKILIVGAGPTANEVGWNSEGYDYIWSTNHFFLNDKLKNLNISLANIGDEVNFSDKTMHEYFENHDTVLCFENVGRSQDELVNFKKKYNDRVFWAHTRYHSKIGAIPRLATIAILLGVKEIDLVGMDGFITSNLADKHFHAFEKRKQQTGTLEMLAEAETIKRYANQYSTLWDYLLHDIGKDVRFRNLGHDHPCNMSTQVLTGVLGEGYQRYLLDRSS